MEEPINFKFVETSPWDDFELYWGGISELTWLLPIVRRTRVLEFAVWAGEVQRPGEDQLQQSSGATGREPGVWGQHWGARTPPIIGLKWGEHELKYFRDDWLAFAALGATASEQPGE